MKFKTHEKKRQNKPGITNLYANMIKVEWAKVQHGCCCCWLFFCLCFSLHFAILFFWYFYCHSLFIVRTFIDSSQQNLSIYIDILMCTSFSSIVQWHRKAIDRCMLSISTDVYIHRHRPTKLTCLKCFYHTFIHFVMCILSKIELLNGNITHSPTRNSFARVFTIHHIPLDSIHSDFFYIRSHFTYFLLFLFLCHFRAPYWRG